MILSMLEGKRERDGFHVQGHSQNAPKQLEIGQRAKNWESTQVTHTGVKNGSKWASSAASPTAHQQEAVIGSKDWILVLQYGCGYPKWGIYSHTKQSSLEYTIERAGNQETLISRPFLITFFCVCVCVYVLEVLGNTIIMQIQYISHRSSTIHH